MYVGVHVFVLLVLRQVAFSSQIQVTVFVSISAAARYARYAAAPPVVDWTVPTVGWWWWWSALFRYDYYRHGWPKYFPIENMSARWQRQAGRLIHTDTQNKTPIDTQNKTVMHTDTNKYTQVDTIQKLSDKHLKSRQIDMNVTLN